MEEEKEKEEGRRNRRRRRRRTTTTTTTTMQKAITAIVMARCKAHSVVPSISRVLEQPLVVKWKEFLAKCNPIRDALSGFNVPIRMIVKVRAPNVVAVAVAIAVEATAAAAAAAAGQSAFYVTSKCGFLLHG
ncbi:hypothetical protein V1478_006534 [Vespula squamosa]|uniref:Uncharacterized protein n=1 Tax=Vespula squamosa TaxID=30214 RepID=A0ABD2B862_VESSQ